MSMHTFPLNDDDFEEMTIADARAEEKSGGWSITRADGWSFFVPKSSPVAPAAGMLARFYPGAVGFSVRGLFLDGKEVFYRTAAGQKQHEREERYGKNAADLVRKWDADETIWSITLGGFGPGYEQALVIAAVEFAREGLDVPLEGDRDAFFREGWDEVCMHALERIKPWFTGMSGAQYDAAKWLAWQWVHGDGPAFVADKKYDDHTIQVSRRWVAGCAAHALCVGIPAEPQWGPILDKLDSWPNDCRDDDFKHLERLIRAEHARTLDRLDAARTARMAPSDGGRQHE